MIDIKQKIEENFLRFFNGLNEEQKSAVDCIDGPNMVVAGPGTGKTQILATRIANILKKTDTNPYQILCLTYTDAAVIAMRKRLEQVIKSTAYNVNIHTYHSLCNEIITSNSELFGNRNLKHADDLEVYTLVSDILYNLPETNPFKKLKGDLDYYVSELINFFGTIKKENYDIEALKVKLDTDFQNKVDDNAFSYKKKYGNFEKGDIKQGEYNKAKEKVDKHIAALDLYVVFDTKMKEANYYDFSDMILWVIKAFKENPDFLLNYQEKFLYFLVDEFQDTNGSQMELLNLLTNYDDSPNFFIVGDEDQSIYRFQGANIDNIKKFDEKFHQTLHKSVLVQNYRSTQSILDYSKALIEYNNERLKNIDKNIVASGKNKLFDNVPPVFNSYYNPIQEAIGVGQKIVDLKAGGVPLREIVVLYKNHNHVDDLKKYLTHHEIPFATKKNISIFEEILVTKLLVILEYIHLENKVPYSGKHLLFKILNFDFYNIQPLDIVRINIEAKNNKMEWRNYLSNMFNEKNTLFEAFSSKDSKAELMRLASDLEYWIKEMHNATLPILVEKIIAKGGILSYVMNSNEKRKLLQIVRTFFDFIKDLAAKKPGLTIQDVLETVENYQKSGLSLNCHEVIEQGDAVNLMSLHGSKGLEFDYVFIIKSNENTWNSKRTGSLNFNFVNEQLGDDEKEKESAKEENRRLFFVGMTRAKKGLNISFNRTDAKGKDLVKVSFISEIESKMHCETKEINISDAAIFNFESNCYSENAIPDFELIDHSWLNEKLAKYELSATHLNSYLKCPVSFYFNTLLQIPSAKSPNMAFGTIIHSALEQLFKQKKISQKMPDVAQLLTYFEAALYKNRDSFTDKEYENYKILGNNNLPIYYNDRKIEWEQQEDYLLEERISGIVFNGVPLKGQLDKILLWNNDVAVVDYKTGNVKNAAKKFNPPSDVMSDKAEEVYGGDYWRQMVFYKILIDNQNARSWRFKYAKMSFVEPDSNNKIYEKMMEISAKDVEIVKSQITETYDRIKNHEFNQGCGETRCEWCNFVKYYLKKEIYPMETLPGSKLEE